MPSRLLQFARPLLLALALVAALPAGAFLVGDADAPRLVLEYFNEFTGHFVLLSDPAEIAGVDAGSAGPGWKRTGFWFHALADSHAPNVCRFYSRPYNSHFFTADPLECDYVRTHDADWTYEKTDFAIATPRQGVCAAGLTPVYRTFNNRWRENDGNHRFQLDPAIRDDMVALGWSDEGVAFCALDAGRDTQKSFLVATNQVRPSAECEDESINLGPCIALNQIPRLVNAIMAWAPPWYLTRGENYSLVFEQVTGLDSTVFTAQPPFDTNAVAQHSFAQASFPTSSDFGIHVSAADRTFGLLASINPLYQLSTAVPAAGTSDARVFPWAWAHDNQIDLSFTVLVETLRRKDSASHAYGHPTLQFRDLRSGHQLYVTIGTFGTNITGPADIATDYTAVDGGTGRVIVGTMFRADPAFGKRITGDALACHADASSGDCGVSGPQSYHFRIRRADFPVILARARALDPALSTDPADYFLANFHFNNEIYGNAELGLTLSGYRLEISGY
jgi:hypothetical protein